MLLGKDTKAEEWRTAVGADLAATSLTQALGMCVNEARADMRTDESESLARQRLATKVAIPSGT
jgi:hypothetical protein